uniref:Replication initiator protein n=2 Tax=Dulem virus 227 TaxID=3145704 RepID=A0AAU8B3U2_9VIRU
MNYPYLQCLKPAKIYNQYTHEHQLVLCGKCVACMNKRASRNKRLCELEEMGSYKYSYFITLTYKPECLPMYELVPASVENLYGVIDRNPRSETKGQFITDNTIYISKHEFYVLNKYVQSGKEPLPKNHFGYLYYRDVQLFNKLLRKRILQEYGEQIRYFVVGEYGPKSFRPHWHILYFTKSPLPAAFCERYLLPLWKNGGVDADRTKGGAANYAASYINSAFALPSVYKTLKISPAARHSIKLGYEIIQKQTLSKIAQSVSDATTRKLDTSTNLSVSGVVKRFPFDITYKSSIYPKPFRFESVKSDKSLLCYLRAYTHYSECFRDFAPTSVKQLTTLLYDYFRYGNLTNYDLALYALLDFSPKDSLVDFDEKVFFRLYRFMLYSKLFVSRLRDDPNYLDKLLSFYDKTDYTNLVSQYETQQEYFLNHPCTDEALSAFYVTTFDQKKLEIVSIYSTFLTMHQSVHEAKLSRKRFNDASGVLKS